jgi:hypothetical protein
MNLNTMTIAERERLAYAEGFVETAKLLARLDDMHQALGRALSDDLSDETELLEQHQELIDERDRLQAEQIDLREENDQLFDDYQTMRAERDAARVAVKMAIDLLENPDAGADEATAVLNYLRDAW